MGGSGSGRWGWHDLKPRVEECARLTIGAYLRAGALRPGERTAGTVMWKLGGGEQSSVGFALDLRSGVRPALHLSYRTRASPDPIEYPILLQFTPSRGRPRWWFSCPLSKDGANACGRRAAHLCLRGKYIGCRLCHGLAYTSGQASSRRVAAFVRSGRRVFDLRPGRSVADLAFHMDLLAREARLSDKVHWRLGDPDEEPRAWAFGPDRPGPPRGTVDPPPAGTYEG